jgi:UDP-N-acetylglucosamine:LPS N-acetylglucosamine transferase
VRGLNPPGFATLPARAVARAALELPLEAPVILVSGGGWGVGDVEGAVDVALGVTGAHAVVLCGTNTTLRTRLAARYGNEPRVRTLGFTDRMPEVMAAADVLVHSTAGLTVLEATICGCRAISYGWGRGHIRANNRAFLRHGLADVAADRPALQRAIAVALSRPAQPDRSWAQLPVAADVLLERLPALQRRS